ncbi:DUF1542 domain-containing protein [Carnobacteriaceae bacterium zg-84]|nr:DUF1542 domain-containing protein [Carnobacteriaceae bacterium zg-84]
MDDAKAAKDTAIDEKFNNKELTETERDDAKKAAKQAADTAKEAIDAATNVEGVNTAKTEGLPKVNAEVNGAIKSNAKQDMILQQESQRSHRQL